jgi:DNA-binding winged helix-turn-helix (wHTH) protein
MWEALGMSYVFEDMELDTTLFELRRRGASVPMEPQAFDVLAYLVAHRDRVVTKEDLMDQIWGGRFVSETAVTSRIKQARRAIGDDGAAQRMIRTVHGRGYGFVAPVSEQKARAATTDRGGSHSTLPPVHYTVSDGLDIAYQVTGEGARDIVLVAGFISHLDHDWGDPRHAHFLDRLGTMGRLIRFDKRGTGMSGRPKGRTRS